MFPIRNTSNLFVVVVPFRTRLPGTVASAQMGQAQQIHPSPPQPSPPLPCRRRRPGANPVGWEHGGRHGHVAGRSHHQRTSPRTAAAADAATQPPYREDLCPRVTAPPTTQPRHPTASSTSSHSRSPSHPTALD
jgi:hypothetical protein